MKFPILSLAIVFMASSCNKVAESIINKAGSDNKGQFTQYIIRQGEQFCQGNNYVAVETPELKFTVRFDSTAIYKTKDPVNQYDINKLYGFSDNNSDHHNYSARFGWRWSDNALRLFAYVYNKGVVTSTELTTVTIGSDIPCSIKIAGDKYIFSVNDMKVEMPRASITDQARGYRLYPYFGGDELAPHEIHVWIRND